MMLNCIETRNIQRRATISLIIATHRGQEDKASSNTTHDSLDQEDMPIFGTLGDEEYPAPNA